MPYKKLYGRTYNLGNFQSEHISVEREFSNAFSPDDAIIMLAREVEHDHRLLEEKRKLNNGGNIQCLSKV